MAQSKETHFTLDELPPICTNLKLVCRKCGQEGVYDVGTILCDTEVAAGSEEECAFTNYFRCRNCNSGGPWRIADYDRLINLTMRAVHKPKSAVVFAAKSVVFNGTFSQCPAMGEDYLLGLHRRDPDNAFLCTRLGNLLRGCGHQAEAAPWYEKALERDPGDVEARYHLFTFAAHADDLPAALAHARSLVRSLLEGRTTNRDELTEGLAYEVAELLRTSPEPFRRHFLTQEGEASNRKEDVFIRTLLQQDGDEEEIQADAAERLLDGEPVPMEEDENDLIIDSDPVVEPAIDLVPSLRQIVESEGLNPELLTVLLEPSDHGGVRVADRHSIHLHDGKKQARWQVPSLRELFRGNRVPPNLEHYPPEYGPYFYFIERQVLTLCTAKHDPSDQEFEDIYSTLRRRPDGRSLGSAHDFLWQVAAVLLGRNVLSGTEFEEIFGQLARSVRHWALRPVSRNYSAYLHQNMESRR